MPDLKWIVDVLIDIEEFAASHDLVEIRQKISEVRGVVDIEAQNGAAADKHSKSRSHLSLITLRN